MNALRYEDFGMPLERIFFFGGAAIFAVIIVVALRTGRAPYGSGFSESLKRFERKTNAGSYWVILGLYAALAAVFIYEAMTYQG